MNSKYENMDPKYAYGMNKSALEGLNSSFGACKFVNSQRILQ